MKAVCIKQSRRELQVRRFVRQSRRLYKRLFMLASVLGCLWGGALPAQAGFASSLVPYKDTLWLVFYVLIGLFVFVAIWEITIMVLLKRAEANGELEPETGDTEQAPAADGGLMSDSEDPFQALLQQADVPKPQPEPAHAAPSAPSGSPASAPAGNKEAVSSPKASPAAPQRFNGASTVAVGAMSGNVVPGNAPNDSDDPFSRLTKLGTDEAGAKAGAPSMTIAPKPLSMAPMAGASQMGGAAPSATKQQLSTSAPVAPKPLSMASSEPAKPLGMAGPGSPRPLNMAVPGSSKPLDVASSANPNTVRMNRSELPSLAPLPNRANADQGAKPAFAGNATVAVRPGGTEAKVGSGSQSAVRPLGMAGSTRSTVAGTPAAEGKLASDNDDPWKKLLGQAGGRMGASGLNRSPGGAGMPISARPATGTGGSAGPVANDPWKALLNNAGKGSTFASKPAAQSNGLALDLKKNDSPGIAKENQ